MLARTCARSIACQWPSEALPSWQCAQNAAPRSWPRRFTAAPRAKEGIPSWHVRHVMVPPASNGHPSGIRTFSDGTTPTGWLMSPGPFRRDRVQSPLSPPEVPAAVIIAKGNRNRNVRRARGARRRGACEGRFFMGSADGEARCGRTRRVRPAHSSRRRIRTLPSYPTGPLPAGLSPASGVVFSRFLPLGIARRLPRKRTISPRSNWCAGARRT